MKSFVGVLSTAMFMLVMILLFSTFLAELKEEGDKRIQSLANSSGRAGLHDCAVSL